jgi:hypothetical protein
VHLLAEDETELLVAQQPVPGAQDVDKVFHGNIPTV